MQYYPGWFGGQADDAWGLQPPLLPNGSPFAASELIDTDHFATTELFFPISRTGERTDLTFFFWGAYVATSKGRDAIESLEIKDVWFSPAKSSEGDELWVVRCPSLSGCVDLELTKATRYPSFPSHHSHAHLSGQFKDMFDLCLISDAVSKHDLFYVVEYRTIILVSKRLIDSLHESGITGVGVSPFPRVSLSTK